MLHRLQPLKSMVLPVAVMAAAGSVACGSNVIAPVVPALSVTRILAFGDSLTEGDATPSGFNLFSIHPTPDAGNPKGYPYKLLGLLTERYPAQAILVYNGGYGGQAVASDANGIGRTLDEFIDAFSPQVMILMHGANDLNAASPNVQTIAGFVGQLVDKAKARGVAVIVSSLPPRQSGGTPDRGNHPELVVPFNSALATMAAQKGARYIDIYPLIAPALGGPDLAPDGLHLTQSGNATLAGAYFALLRSIYETSK